MLKPRLYRGLLATGNGSANRRVPGATGAWTGVAPRRFNLDFVSLDFAAVFLTDGRIPARALASLWTAVARSGETAESRPRDRRDAADDPRNPSLTALVR
jgi:hypothetical protein